jgi:hypothetical protein
MRVVALTFALTLLAANVAAAACWSEQVVDTSDKTLTTAEAPIQTPAPTTESDS